MNKPFDPEEFKRAGAATTPKSSNVAARAAAPKRAAPPPPPPPQEEEVYEESDEVTDYQETQPPASPPKQVHKQTTYRPPPRPDRSNGTYGAPGKSAAHGYLRLGTTREGREFFTIQITDAGWKFISENEPGSYKFKGMFFEDNIKAIRSTGDGYGRMLIGQGYFNRKDWSKGQG